MYHIDIFLTKHLFSIESSGQLNMRGVFLHVLGDALGSVIVIISALIVIFVKADWKYKVDPAMRYLIHYKIKQYYFLHSCQGLTHDNNDRLQVRVLKFWVSVSVSVFNENLNVPVYSFSA